jgi:hypothetical protein
MADGSRHRPRIGSGAPGRPVRAWLVEIPDRDVDRVVGFDATGDPVVTAPFVADPATPPPTSC